ncbi:MAG: DUF1592 domain-containing protein [Verrucomicrobia bacterium]|nr:DUF1592 domain-containing protein [Verrucomicrobiota bacterium]
MVRNSVHKSPGDNEVSKFTLSFRLFLIVSFLLASCGLSAVPTLESAFPVIKQYCFDCHGAKKTKGDINFEELVADPSIDKSFKTWELVVEMLEFEEMPPDDEEQPSDQERQSLISTISETLDYAIQINAGDPGEIALRRLTSAEYAYTVQDLTGLDLDLEKSFVGEAVGGEGFSNVGEVQFMQDATLEQYLKAAKLVASHALIGAGPLQFYSDPGMTGQELSAINRILSIYQEHGFSTGAGEGAMPYGLDRYPKAFYASWRYMHRDALRLPNLTLEDLAETEGIEIRFLEHIWSVLNDDSLSFPSTVIVSGWRELPAPQAESSANEQSIRLACVDLYDLLQSWQKALAANSVDDEEAPALSEDNFRPTLEYSFKVRINKAKDAIYSTANISVIPAGEGGEVPAVLWKNPQVVFALPGNADPIKMPLVEAATDETRELLKFGIGFDGAPIAPSDFITLGSQELTVQFSGPSGLRGAVLSVDVELDVEHGDDCFVRCVISDGRVEGEEISSTGAASALLANPASPDMEARKTGVAELARNLPQVSHRKPAPSDRDPIPAPFDNTYNKPERNSFHYILKYHRDDRFLAESILDDATRQELDIAWTDLLTSFDYHDTFLRFIVKKFGLDAGERTIADLTPDWIEKQSPETVGYIHRLYDNYQSATQTLESAEPGHLEDVLSFTERAWRRPLTQTDRKKLVGYYDSLRSQKELDHPEAVRLLLARILIAPEFLYRIEQPKESAPVVALSNFELASRLSFFLWSSPPDTELMRAAEAGELSVPENLAHQARRMLTDPKARRFATEFFGQWFGFYRFDDFSGIDASHFTEFSDDLKEALYDESVSFFEYIVTADRPVDDVLFADYTFLNQKLAEHYRVPFEVNSDSGGSLQLVQGTRKFNRGGLLQQGTILATTSAPLRTSAVKRGDWILRRILNTPTPPPPADAGSIPAEEVLADGLTVRDRLEAHRRDESCVNCHTRIDPLGFALENFNPLGQWRETYSDGGVIETTGILNDGTEITGMEDLFSYLQQEKGTFYNNLCRKLLGYALGRSEILSDRLLIDKMVKSLDDDKRFSNLVAQVVTSPQFRHKRGQSIESAKNTKDEDSDSPI